MFRPMHVSGVSPALRQPSSVLRLRSAKNVYVSAMSAAQPLDGSSWISAFHAVQDGVNAATPDGEVWVAGGSYAQPVVMAQSVRLYDGMGGAAGQRAYMDDFRIEAGDAPLVPEPATLTLLACALPVCWRLRRRAI